MDPAISVLGTYPKNTKSSTWKDICTPKFIVALFTIPMIWKQPNCLMSNEWIRKLLLIHTHTNTTKLKERCYNQDKIRGSYLKPSRGKTNSKLLLSHMIYNETKQENRQYPIS